MIDLPLELEQDLLRQAEQSNISLQTLILQALCQIIQTSSVSTSQFARLDLVLCKSIIHNS